jgi:hypothetical protein
MANQSMATRIAEENRKETTINLIVIVVSLSFPCGLVHRHLHSQSVQKGSLSLNKLDNKPDGFLFSKWLIVRHNNSTQLIKLLWQQSFTTGLKKMIFCQSKTFVFLADPEMNVSFTV